MKVKCKCGVEGFLEKRGNSFRVKHYIGTLSEISDKYSADVGIAFYKYLFQGHSIGESLKKARESLKNNLEIESFCWTNYVLYGDPGSYLLQSDNPGFEKPINTPETQIMRSKSVKGTSSSSKEKTPNKKPALISTQRNKILFTLVSALLVLSIFAFSRFYVKNTAFNRKEKEKRVKEVMEAIYVKVKERENIRLAHIKSNTSHLNASSLTSRRPRR